jgi:hypothetical protein
MAVDLEVRFNGKRLESANVARAVEAAAFDRVKDVVQRKLESIRCPEHGDSPRVSAQGASLRTVTWTLHGCCDRLKAEARRVLS